jgi:hypothetical protein
LQIAKEKLWRLESAQFLGDDCPLPTRTPVGEVIAALIDHMQAHRPERSWRRDPTDLRGGFDECCDALTLETRRAKKCRELRRTEDRRRKRTPRAHDGDMCAIDPPNATAWPSAGRRHPDLNRGITDLQLTRGSCGPDPLAESSDVFKRLIPRRPHDLTS